MQAAERSSDNSSPSLIVLTGISGAGKKAAAAVLEDMGWYVADNLPPELILRMVEMTCEDDSPIERLAISTDVRSLAFAGSLNGVLSTLQRAGKRPTVLYLDASDETLISRYEALRRTHPLQEEGTLQDGINQERAILADLRKNADIVLDTSTLNVHELRRTIEELFTGDCRAQFRINIQSFGFKHGPPKDIDMLLDARFLANPYWIPELKGFRGTDQQVKDYVLGQPDSTAFLDAAENMVMATIPGFIHEGKKFLSLGVGCTGGHHRSVALAEELQRRFDLQGLTARVSHRDLAK
ncbi:RNase adapter RapZ [Corynebacterium sp. 320]|uniref:RNase adapter RapZ n=1 Tax=Corynebacterium TaxID=1716 RepID=UPI00125CCA6D|nr:MULTISPECIES: RNase adapter RapZ [Corynebacterium]KAB1503681.1 RNase adapter RapZ [Corynebacterium sp. 320]KAB1553218.1 RNase adapter RapZ [Corynebacterium sp. 321]KAB1553563.1 RNase adapter RapZ [Corynebacterium sp. 319]KAB3527817.1 RNase adapter RapZ [Corynebacterium sp. 250]KAB3540694.1 RNase adapter RapZ [Corynebacterium sp. 366]